MCSLLQTQLFSLHTFHTYIFPIHVLCSFYLNQQYHLSSGTVVSGQIIMMRLKVMHPKRCGLFTERSVFGSRYKYDPQLALGVLSAVNKPRTRQSVVAQLWSFLLSPSFQTPSQRQAWAQWMALSMVLKELKLMELFCSITVDLHRWRNGMEGLIRGTHSGVLLGTLQHLGHMKPSATSYIHSVWVH